MAEFDQDATDRLQTLIDDLLTDEPQATLLVAGPSPASGYNYRMQPFVADVENLVATQFQNDSNVHYVNMDSPFLNPDGSENLSLFNDGVHPNAAGYSIMAQTWESAIMADVDFADYEATPEPSTAGLFAIGGVLLLAWRRYGRRA